MDIQAQLASLIVRALPTIIIFGILYLVMNAILFTPLRKVLEERYRLTEGAKKAAEDALASASQKTGEYEEKLRLAKNEMYREIEEARKRSLADQAKAITEAKHRSQELIAGVQEELRKETDVARRNLLNESEALADQLVARLLNGRAA
jgi:F-type H+-transporting ATPase subunit b